LKSQSFVVVMMESILEMGIAAGEVEFATEEEEELGESQIWVAIT